MADTFIHFIYSAQVACLLAQKDIDPMKLDDFSTFT